MIDRRMALLSAGASALFAGLPALSATLPEASAYLRIASETEDNLKRHVTNQWFPRAMDTKRGGFRQNFAEDWSPIDADDRATVYQGRLTWLAAEASHYFPAERSQWVDRVNHGVAFLADHMWDREFGGFFWSLGATPPHAPDRDGEKHMYGHAFGLYAAATAYHRTRNPRALKLAMDAFAWMEAHSHDAVNGGYVESISRKGTKQLAPPAGLLPLAGDDGAVDALRVPFGQKSMNTHIHILEALTALYAAVPDPLVRLRLEEMLTITRDKIATRSGYLNLYFRADWTAVPRAISFGHDVEAAFLITDASTALGRPDDSRTWEVARLLVDCPPSAPLRQIEGFV